MDDVRYLTQELSVRCFDCLKSQWVITSVYIQGTDPFSVQCRIKHLLILLLYQSLLIKKIKGNDLSHT